MHLKYGNFSRRHLLIDLYSVSFMWYTPIAVGTVILVGIIVSYLTRSLEPHEVDPKLIIPVVDMCCCCLPRRWLQYGVNEEAYLAVKVCLLPYLHQ